MDQELTSAGICSTCNHKSGCLSYKKNEQAGKLVLHCEAFDDSPLKINAEKVFSPIPFVTTPCLDVKRLIPGWNFSEST